MTIRDDVAWMYDPRNPEWRRDDSWSRPKRYGEKWPRFSAEIPPELAPLLDAAQRRSLGVNASPRNATRANLVRAGLRLYLNAVHPEPDAAIDSTAIDIIDRPQLKA